MRASPIHAAVTLFLSHMAGCAAPAAGSGLSGAPIDAPPGPRSPYGRVDEPVARDAAATPSPSAMTTSEQAPDAPPTKLHVNQLGYLPYTARRATLASDSPAPLRWQLIDAQTDSVAKGETRVVGFDRASGEHVHVIDFGTQRPSGSYRLRAGEQQSHAFSIDPDVYRQLRADALAFFYHQRSGTEIRLPYARQERWVRPAGHLGDRSVRCAPASGCDYALDVSGGWYDAGDHGKYVVNAGVSVWTLQNLFERSAAAGKLAALADGSANIPERDNGVSDLLDEVRWELEFLLKMQVPDGQPLAGMAHHKIHDADFTPLPTAPHEDTQPRWLQPPSTAASLNLAAVTAQAARIYRGVAGDGPEFSARCLAAARRAFDAALAHPALYAPATNNAGGGPYDDSDVRDEFYWAAAELLITTGEPRYRRQLARFPIETTFTRPRQAPGEDRGALTWQEVAAAGTISLAFAPDSLADLRERARAAIGRAADALTSTREQEGYGVPFEAKDGKYPWGSNSFVLNNALVLGVAFQLLGDGRYLDGVVSAIDYVLGANPLDQSYVTGYGARPLRNPHHRFFARQLNRDRPEPPPGFVSGGPNSGLQDPWARGAGLPGCAPQRCFVDHIESWSTNEVTINWNAPLAWVAAFLDDQAHSP